jgi:hypothetical protein
MFMETVKAQVATIYQGNPGISESERQRRLEDVDRDLLDAELAEESIIRAAEASGFPVLPQQLDPQALLAADEALP